MKKNQRLKRLVSIITVILMLSSVSSFDAAALSEDDVLHMDRTEYTKEHLEFADDSDITGVTGISYPFLDTADVAFDWTFPYSDDLFRKPSDKFSVMHSRASLGLALSAFRSTTGVVSPQYKKYLGDAGFTNFYTFGYDEETTKDSLSGIIGMKEIDGFTVIAAVTCGQGYQNEWAGNFEVGTGSRHEGFEKAAGMLTANIEDYIENNNIKGSKKLWLGGMSRAAAVANIAAADAIESGDYEDVYAYLFGVPRTTREPLNYSGIYNICGEYDPVAAMPLQSWGYERYGMDLYTPAQETDPDFPKLVTAADAIGKKMDGKGYRNNPEVNYQLRLIIEWMDEFFTDSDDFNKRLAPLLSDAVINHDSDQIMEILRDAISKLAPKDDKEKTAVRVMLDYLSFVAGQHTRAEQRQIEDGSWDPTESLAANLVIEHRGSQYAKWLFADVDPAKLFTPADESRRVIMTGDVFVSVFKDGVKLETIYTDGEVSGPDDQGDKTKGVNHNIFMMKNGSQILICLPGAEEYSLKIAPKKKSTVTYYGLVGSSADLLTDMGLMHVHNLSKDIYTIDVVPGDDLTSPVDEEGEIADGGSTLYNYSPTLVMKGELDATEFSHISLGRAIKLVLWVINLLNLLILICIIVFFVHRRQIKKGHPPYSDWYVIMPHLIIITGLALLTQFMTFFLTPLKAARAECAALTLLFIGLLALRGAIRSQKKWAFAYSAALLVGAYMTHRFYSQTPMDSYSRLKMYLYFAIVLVLSIASVKTFKRKNTEISSEALTQESERGNEISGEGDDPGQYALPDDNEDSPA
jgi:hypothetical protein